VRERTAELAVLKAVGYSDRFVLLFVMMESLVVALFGGFVGLLSAKLFELLLKVARTPLDTVLPYFYIPANALLVGLALALAIGTASGLLPALGAMRLRVVDALRRV